MQFSDDTPAAYEPSLNRFVRVLSETSGAIIDALRMPEKQVPGLSPADQHLIDRESAYGFARLLIGSLITTCAGALLAFLAFLGQQKSLDAHTLQAGLWALTWLGLALLLALSTSAFAYFNQAFLAFSGEKRWLASASILASFASLLALAIGAALALWTVYAALTPH